MYFVLDRDSRPRYPKEIELTLVRLSTTLVHTYVRTHVNTHVGTEFSQFFRTRFE